MTDSPRIDSAGSDSFHPEPPPHNGSAQSRSSDPADPQTPHPSHPGPAPYEGTDPELSAPAEAAPRRVNVSTVQVGASAAAAVTSALAASFFGVAGTLIGAAVGSIVSTVAGALYADSLKRAGNRLRTTRSVVIQRIPADVLATTPLRHLTDPAGLPGPPSLRPAGEATNAETVAVPLQDQNELLAELNAVDPTTVISPAQTSTTTAQDDAHRPWYRRPLITLPAIGLAGFLIALAVVTIGEGAIGGPISGGNGGTTVGKAFHRATTSSGTDQKPTPQPSTTSSTGSTTPTGTEATTPPPVTAAPTVAPSSTSAGPSTQPGAGAPSSNDGVDGTAVQPSPAAS